MADIVLQVSGLNMAYRKKAVLGGTCLTVRKGEICGLLGPNGSGKTTLLKIIAGLAVPQQGEITLFGQPYSPQLLRRCGFLIGRPRLHREKTVEQNLRIHQALLGIPDDRVDDIMKQSGLAQVSGTKAGKLSLGIGQRLGIAMALQGNPDLLILDEPFNGIDAQSMFDLRQKLAKLNQEQGVTILITSHLLDEVARLATSYAFLQDGVIRQQTAAEIQDKSRQYAELVTLDSAAAAVVLEQIISGENAFEVMPDGSFRFYQGLDRLPEINAALVQAGVPVSSLSLKSDGLTGVYLEETRKGNNHA